MPKPSGRYFASTIAKLRAFKKAEYIAVDEDLRASLRRELLVKADALGKFQTAPFLEKISKFKRYLALAPMFLLLLVVIAGLSKLSVQFKESAFIPVVPFQIETSQKIEQKPVSAPFVGVVGSTLETTQAPQKTEASKTVKITDAKNKQTVITGERISGGVPQSSSVVIIPSTPVTISGSQMILPTSPTYPTLQLPPETPARILPQSAVPVVPQPFTPVPAESKPMPEIKTPTPSPVTGKVPNVIEQTTPYKQPSSKTVDEKPTVVTKEPVKLTPNTAQPATTNVPTAAEQKVQYEEMYSEPKEVEIYFKGRFSNDERVLLRDNVIPELVENKNATYVQVRETPNEGFAVIEVYLDNQDVETYIYNLHEHTMVQG